MTSENPYSPPRAESERPIRELPAVRLASLFFSLQLLVIVLGIAAACFISTETIIATGVVLVLVGLVLSVVAWRCNDPGLMACGISGPAFSVFILLLILFNDWYPREARMPVLMLSGSYLICFLLVAAWLFFHRQRSAVQNTK